MHTTAPTQQTKRHASSLHASIDQRGPEVAVDKDPVFSQTVNCEQTAASWHAAEQLSSVYDPQHIHSLQSTALPSPPPPDLGTTAASLPNGQASSTITNAAGEAL